MKKIVHILASIVSMTCIGTFMLATIYIELMGEGQDIAFVKNLIVSPGLFVLVPAIMLAGASGFSLSIGRKGRLVEAKKKRMPVVALNGVFVLIPSAIFLDQWASVGAFDTSFYILQVIELLAGSVNLTLMGMNMRDGFRLSGRFR